MTCQLSTNSNFYKTPKYYKIMKEYFINIIDFLQNLLSGFVNKILVAVIILLIGFILGKVATRLVEKGLKEIGLNKIIKDVGVKIPLEGIISNFVLYFIYFISIIMALSHLEIATGVLNTLSAVIIILIGIFVVLSVKDFIPNIISGIILHQKSMIKEGDIILINDMKGKVKEITLLDTKLETKSGDLIIVPNSNLTKNQIVKKKRL